SITVRKARTGMPGSSSETGDSNARTSKHRCPSSTEPPTTTSLCRWASITGTRYPDRKRPSTKVRVTSSCIRERTRSSARCWAKAIESAPTSLAGHTVQLVFTKPDDLSESHLIELLGAAWELRVDDIEYVPVGFGSHHWQATSDGK